MIITRKNLTRRSVLTRLILVAGTVTTLGLVSNTLVSDSKKQLKAKIKDKKLVLEDTLINPRESKIFNINLKSEGGREVDTLSLAPYLEFPGGWGGVSPSLSIKINGRELNDENIPKGLETLSFPFLPESLNHSKVRILDPKTNQWVVFYSKNLLPPTPNLPKSLYYSPEREKTFLLNFRNIQLRDSENKIEITNQNHRYPLILSSEDYGPKIEKELETLKKRKVPSKRILDPKYRFEKPNPEDIYSAFLFLHEQAEQERNRDGSWGKGCASVKKWEGRKSRHPLVRHSALPAIAYLEISKRKKDPIFLTRAKEALKWLIQEQDNSGAFKWYYTPEGIIDSNSLYGGGLAGVALIRGFEILKDEECLKASKKLANWECQMGDSNNANYDMFAVRHLAELFRVTGNIETLTFAVKKTLEVLNGQMPEGNWSDDHNQYLGYHGIITNGLIELSSVIPDSHPAKEEILEGTTRAINHIINQQKPNGRFIVHPRENKKEWSGLSEVLVNGIEKLNLPLEEILNGVLRATIPTTKKPSPYFNPWPMWSYALSYNHLIS